VHAARAMLAERDDVIVTLQAESIASDAAVAELKEEAARSAELLKERITSLEKELSTSWATVAEQNDVIAKHVARSKAAETTAKDLQAWLEAADLHHKDEMAVKDKELSDLR
jgi:hypothetical protein